MTSVSKVLRRNWLHLVMIPLASLWAAPMVWIVVTSLKERNEVFDPNAGFWPKRLVFDNYLQTLEVAPFAMYMVNSVIVTGAILACQLVTITLAAYAFARLEFPGKKLLFTFFMLQVMFPIYATFLTNFVTMHDMGIVNTIPAMIVPFVASGYGTFMLRQSFRQVPSELSDAARLDGCGHLSILWHVYLPLVKPTLIAFGIISVVTHWNDYMWPLLVTNSDSIRTLPIGLGLLAKAGSGADWTRLMAGTFIVVAPLLLAFVIFQRRFIDSFMHTGVK
ncbi:carbohydrate ABC transporter permease [Rhizobium sp. AN80A]|uniref:carbohydrate ABC transporter permease n=1 Tax=Rhizobium sp. AN80A TaxID=3040673 RepID=UPI0024B3B4B2|nr:carbohydrate ABC transporter permease [Rhizobium sp. AN80A]